MGLIKYAKLFILASFLSNINIQAQEQQTKTNKNENFEVKYSSYISVNPYLQKQKSWKQIFAERFERNFTNRFNINNLTTNIFRSDIDRELLYDIFAQETKQVARKSASQTARIIASETLPLEEIRGEIGLRLRDAFLGKDEKNLLSSLFDKKEGVPGLENTEKSRINPNLKYGIRPFDGFGYATYVKESYRLHARADTDNVQTTAQIIISPSVVLNLGIIREWDKKTPMYGFAGFSGFFKKGIFSFGTTINGDCSWFSAGYSKKF